MSTTSEKRACRAKFFGILSLKAASSSSESGIGFSVRGIAPIFVIILIARCSIVSVESESAYAPETLLPEAIKVMRSKIASIKQAAEALTADTVVEGAGALLNGGDMDVDMAHT